jgi:hypothetical protein
MPALLSQKLQIPIPKSQEKFNRQILKRAGDHRLFEIIDEKIRVNSRASAANVSRAATLLFAKPASTNRKNRRLSFDSLRQIFTRMRKSFLLRASSASIQLAATEPDARTNCRTSSVLLTVRGNCFTNVRTDCANSRFGPPGRVVSSHPPFWNFGFDPLFGIWSLGFGTCSRNSLLSEWRRNVGTGRRRKFERRWRKRRACLIGIAGHHPIAIRLQHVRAFSLQVTVEAQSHFLKDSFH